jgi:hypothetical protein
MNKDQLTQLIVTWMIGMVWGFASYIHTFLSWVKFSFLNLIATWFVSFFVAYVVGLFIPITRWDAKYGIVWLSWAVSLQLLDFFIKDWAKMIVGIIKFLISKKQ